MENAIGFLEPVGSFPSWNFNRNVNGIDFVTSWTFCCSFIFNQIWKTLWLALSLLIVSWDIRYIYIRKLGNGVGFTFYKTLKWFKYVGMITKPQTFRPLDHIYIFVHQIFSFKQFFPLNFHKNLFFQWLWSVLLEPNVPKKNKKRLYR